jgi:hypothetical protein
MSNDTGSDCSALVKACERTIKYLREIGESVRGESTFPSAEYADAMADDLEHAMKPTAAQRGAAMSESRETRQGARP